ncbi:MAG: inositol monophosphatase [Deltaproteobacteria bacterium]|nr:inositol monophosphatase [Deltaproteobacteria bacterium]MCL5791728.1 inositol monophosphatase [Deltaproteobacteria bacterium]
MEKVKKMISHAELLSIAEKAAKVAGDIIRKRISGYKEVSYKGVVDLVTDVDKLSERKIIRVINKYFPEHSILTEEMGSISRKSDYKWIIDPIDGTTNFFHAYPFVSVSIAVEHKGKIITGVVHDPLKYETFTAINGKGAFLNGKRIHVSRIHAIEQSLLSTGFPYDIRHTNENNIDNWIRFLKRAQAIRRDGSAALDLCYVAAGRFDGFWEMKLKPWDVSAGSLIVNEAGGKVTDFLGEHYSIYNNSIVASNGIIHGDLLDVLNER